MTEDGGKLAYVALVYCWGLFAICVPVGEITATPLRDTCYLPRDDLGQLTIKSPHHSCPCGKFCNAQLGIYKGFESVRGRMRLLLKARALVSMDGSKTHFLASPAGLK